MSTDVKYSNIVCSSNNETEDTYLKENKVKRSLNVCLLQNNESETEGIDRGLKRARRSLSEKSSDNGYDSFLDDVIPLQNLQLSDSDDQLEDGHHKFSMEHKFSDFELYIDSAKTEESDTNMNVCEGHPIPELSNIESEQNLGNIVLDELDTFDSQNSKTWLSSTPSQKTTSSHSTFFETGISPISESYGHRSLFFADLQEDMEESIRLEAKSMSIIFQHEARHASADEKSPSDYDIFLTSMDSDIPSEICFIDSEDEECEKILYNKQEQMSCSEILYESEVHGEARTESKENMQNKEDMYTMAPLETTKFSEDTNNEEQKLKPNVCPTLLQTPQRQPLTVDPLLEIVQSAIKKDKGGNCFDVRSSSSANSLKTTSFENASCEELNKSNQHILRGPIQSSMFVLSSPYSIPPKRKFEQLLCPLLSNYCVKTKCNSSFH